MFAFLIIILLLPFRWWFLFWNNRASIKELFYLEHSKGTLKEHLELKKRSKKGTEEIYKQGN
jgi:hypothetical protein